MARWLFALTVSVVTCFASQHADAAEGKTVPPDHPERVKRGLALFKESVRTTLTKYCLDCHGGKSTKADFDLTTRDGLLKSGYVEKTAADSHLMSLIRHVEEPHMPFKLPRLPDATIEKIGQWIDLGAPYDKPLIEKTGTGAPAELVVTDADRNFWSFKPLMLAKPATVRNETWCRTPIDHFVLAKQEELGLHPNETAERRVLVRRAYFDLLGLPPTPEQVDAFVNNPDPEAWPKLIDELLKSPHYGERWARHWLDIARFAESHGYEQDYDRPFAYHYRDFVIKALNDDLPYDEFVRWQLAGDELAPDNPLAIMATGFMGAGVFPTQLTEKEFESARYDELDDMVTTTGVAFLGLSIGCARCHDHKFDPIPSRDYYTMAASFTTTIRSEIEVDLEPVENQSRKLAWEGKLGELSAAVQDFEKQQVPERFREWLQKAPTITELSPWETLDPSTVASSGGSKFEKQPDGSHLAIGKAPNKEVLIIVADTRRRSIRAIRLEALRDDSLPNKGPGRADNGNFALGDVKITAKPLKGDGAAQNVKLVAARATHQQNTSSLSVAASIDADPISGWAVDVGGIGKDQAAVFDFESPIDFEEGSQLTITLTFNHPNSRHAVGRFRLSVSNREQPKAETGNVGLDAKVSSALTELRNNSDETSAAWKTATGWFQTTLPEWQALSKAVADHKAKGPELKLAKVMVSSEGYPHMSHHADGRGYPHFYPETNLLNRGDVHQKKEVVSQSFLQVLMPEGAKTQKWKVDSPSDWKRTSFRRAALANWITDADFGAGHLAARVIVNRLWQHHFGQGIVSTPNDFGFPGERPTHPALLDWLASNLIDNGWKLKQMHKLMMTSSVYMQSGDFDEPRAHIDRENTWFWRRAPQRLEGEAIRDSMLAVSDQLDRKMFGPGTLDMNMKRRSVYFFIKRSNLIPVMMLFDWPEHLVSIGQRTSTTIAPQALMFMNSHQGRAYAVALASKLQNKPDAIVAGYRLAFGREPSIDERQLAGQFVQNQSTEYREAGRTDADKLALSDLCQTLFSMNEFVYVD
ncbi:MAG: PSD1 and planctomycete cytochrome C domain-containing protein [Planctomycetota bacterium]|nr:PSD1 and planctomycete cytochrome C domain-containing protein [Planctomycetota bacterium]